MHTGFERYETELLLVVEARLRANVLRAAENPDAVRFPGAVPAGECARTLDFPLHEVLSAELLRRGVEVDSLV